MSDPALIGFMLMIFALAVCGAGLSALIARAFFDD
jgi:hypothetical protein